jgi:hypothetical protein
MIHKVRRAFTANLFKKEIKGNAKDLALLKAGEIKNQLSAPCRLDSRLYPKLVLY